MKKTLSHLCLAALAIVSLPLLAAAQDRLENPTAFANVADFIAGFLRAVTLIALPVIAFFIVLAGFFFVKARGNSGELANAKKNFYYVILGAALILGAWVLATLIGGTITQLVRG
jgi:hypothetical protein